LRNSANQGAVQTKSGEEKRKGKKNISEKVRRGGTGEKRRQKRGGVLVINLVVRIRTKMREEEGNSRKRERKEVGGGRQIAIGQVLTGGRRKGKYQRNRGGKPSGPVPL